MTFGRNNSRRSTSFFTTKTEYWRMAPHLELVASHNVLLALPGTEYVAYFPRGGTNSIKLEAGTYAVEWLRAETGQYFPMPAIAVASGNREFVPPNNPGADWVLHLRRQEAATPRSPQEGDLQDEAASFPNPADLPRQPSLPDPLVMLDGRKVTTPEIRPPETVANINDAFRHWFNAPN